MVSLVETMMKLHNSGYSTEDHIVDISNMVGLVETTMTADSLQPTAWDRRCGAGGGRLDWARKQHIMKYGMAR